MSKAIELTDAQYEVLRKAAEARGQTPQTLIETTIAAWQEEQRDPLKEPRYYDTEAWFKHLEGDDFEEYEDEGIDADA